jgi:hypothetical protein
MENIISEIKFYSQFINWVNLFIFLMFFVVLWNWITYFTNFHKRANGIIEHYLRIFIPLPFWIVFLIYNFNFLSPVNFYSDEITFTKQIIIDNNTNSELKLQFVALNKENSKYLFNNFDNYLSKNFKIPKNKRETITFEVNNEIYNKLQIISIDKNEDIFLYGKTFELNNTNLLIYGDEFGKYPIKPLKISHSYYYKILIINFLAIISIWYYYFWAFMRKNKKIFLILSTIVSAITLSSIFFVIRLLLQ